MAFIVIEGDNGCGKTTISKLLKKDYIIITDDKKIKSLEQNAKKYKPGTKERFDCFINYNKQCAKMICIYQNTLIVRYWISTLAAGYADGYLCFEKVEELTNLLLLKLPVPTVVFRLYCDYEERLKRIEKRFLVTNDFSDDISKTRDEKYIQILNYFQTKLPVWININTSNKTPIEIVEQIKNIIKEKNDNF